MSKRQFKSQASSGKASSGFGASAVSTFVSSQSSPLSYIQEPPDYSRIYDANIVVAFKNLSKKDTTTKTKALEDIQSYVSSSVPEIEDGLLEAWVKLYPRLSIDNGNRVRRVAHSLNGLICAKCGKRAAPHLQRIAGAWLAGCNDSDKAAVKAAQDALSVVFPTSGKILTLRKTFQLSILEYCRDAVLKETLQTLSDERSVSIEDAQATYARVVATSLMVISGQLTELAADDQAKSQPLYDEIFGDSKFWELPINPDASIRRACHQLVQICIQHQSHQIETNDNAVSNAYVYKSQSSDQSRSAIDYIKTLYVLTTTYPKLWTDAYTGKKSAASRLRHLLEQGSQGGSDAYWEYLSGLIRKVPNQVLPTNYDDAAELILSARDGATKKDERFNASSAWTAYFAIVDVMCAALPGEEQRKILEDFVMSALLQYLNPKASDGAWNIPIAKAATIVSKAMIVRNFPAKLLNEVPFLADMLVDAVKASQLEQSQGYEISQKSVASMGERWADLQKELSKDAPTSGISLSEAFVAANSSLVKVCIDLLKDSNGKVSGAAAIIESLVYICGERSISDEMLTAALRILFLDETISPILSPSRSHIVALLYETCQRAGFQDRLSTAVHSIVQSQEPMDSKIRVMQDLLPRTMPLEAIKLAKTNQELQDFVKAVLETTSTEGAFNLFHQLFEAGAASDGVIDEILSRIISSLAVEDSARSGLSRLDQMLHANESALKSSLARLNSGNERLLQNLFQLEQSLDDQTAKEAFNLLAALTSPTRNVSDNANFSIVLKNLETPSEYSLAIDAIHKLTSRLIGPSPKDINPRDMLPPIDSWRAALNEVVWETPPSLAILSPLGGALNFAVPTRKDTVKQIQVDLEGFSQAFRIAMYVSRLLTMSEFAGALDQAPDLQRDVMLMLYLTTLVADDNLSISGANGMWHPEGRHDAEAAALDFVTEANSTLKEYWAEFQPAFSDNTAAGNERALEYVFFRAALHKSAFSESGFSALRYYAALAICKLDLNLFELRGHTAEQSKASEAILRERRSKKDTLETVATLVGLQQALAGTQTVVRFCNELVADLTGLDFIANAQTGLEKLVMLNAILRTQEEAGQSVAKQRLIFLVQHLIKNVKLDLPVLTRTENIKVLTLLLPHMQDMYGEHWVQVLSIIKSILSSTTQNLQEQQDIEDIVPLEFATLKLLAALQALAKSDNANEDLIDAIRESQTEMTDFLIKLLKSSDSAADETHQPLALTHEMLARQISQLRPKSLNDADDLYALLLAPSRPVQQAAFELLHRHIPAAQEQISFDAALDDKTARLPDELLSLLLQAPSLESLADESFARSMPLPLHGYLFSWRLLFDHFTSSSYRVKDDYVEQLKNGTYLNRLLLLTFDFLGHTRGKPIDASKFDIKDYIADNEQNSETDVQWLLTHLYYLALTHLPSLTRSYFLNNLSRQTSMAVESWTAKYISPLIITTSLQAVAEWAEKSAKEDAEYEKVRIKVGTQSKEINVSYVVDEQTMAIRIVLPDAYPLAAVQVVGVNRVAVNEEKWQSWLRNCQGVITFSNGSITDGLFAWRKNVTGAMRGQVECAICYSIISADKQLPSKKCPTCKNLFHSTCLFKWFKTSNQSSCPLCRNSFQFS